MTDNNSNVVVKYQHRFYSNPETCTYYKSLSGEQAYKRQVSYTASGLYMNKETFRMDMDLSLIHIYRILLFISEKAAIYAFIARGV